MIRSAAVVLVAASALVFGSVHMVLADDETGDTEITVQAPLDAANCTATPPTISVLGLSIDVSAADIGAETDTASGCAALAVGDSVEVTLASDAADGNGNLDATAVDDQGSGDQEVHIQAPLQPADGNGDAVDANGNVQVLGLLVNVSWASLDGADDNSEDGNSQGIDLTQLTTGQFVDLQLASNQPPLTATGLEVKNFANGIEVEIDDGSGTEVDDSNNDGTSEDDIEVDVEDTTLVQAPSPTPGSGGAAAITTSSLRRVRKTVTFHQRANGGIVSLNGLPTGHVKIAVTRVHNGTITVGHRRVGVRSNTTRFVHVRLR